MRGSRESLLGWASGAALFSVVAAVTAAIHANGLPLAPFAASARRVSAGELWILLSSALVVDRPVIVGLVAFGLLGVAALWFCGPRTFWVAAVVGHVGSTLTVYGIIGLSRVADPHVFARAAVSADYGVSAVQGAWVGALTATAWSRAGADRRRRAAVAAAVAALTAVAWRLHPDPSILTTEHLFAFLIGVAVVSGRRGAARVRAAAGRSTAALARAVSTGVALCRSAPVSSGYLGILLVTTVVLRLATASEADRLLLDRSTNLHHLAHDPVRVTVSSAFWLSRSWLPLVEAAALLLGPVAVLERRVGSRRTFAVLAAGHVGATLLTSAWLWLALRADLVDHGVVDARDVGASYAILAGLGAFAYLLARRLRVPYLVALLGYGVTACVVSATFSDVGHLLAVGIGLACFPLVRGRSTLRPPVGARRAAALAARPREGP